MYRHEELRAHHVGWELPLYQEKRTISGFIRTNIHDLLVLARGAWGLFTAPLGPGGPVHVRALSAVLIIPLILLPLVLRRDWWMRAGAVILILFAIAILPVYWVAKHYGAPAGAVAYLLLFASMRQLHVCSWRHRPIGTYLVGAILLVWLASFAFVCKVLSSSDPQWAPASYRVAFLDALERAGGRHLIFVRYAPDHFVHFDWVFNEADIDGSMVVWARDMGEAVNQTLVRYFPDRVSWLLEADAPRPRLVPYLRGAA